MRNTNATITLILAALSTLAWGLIIFQVFPIILFYGHGLAILLSIATCLGWFITAFAPDRADEFTRCRKCRHILKGITEPRCPECGESI